MEIEEDKENDEEKKEIQYLKEIIETKPYVLKTFYENVNLREKIGSFKSEN